MRGLGIKLITMASLCACNNSQLITKLDLLQIFIVNANQQLVCCGTLTGGPKCDKHCS